MSPRCPPRLYFLHIPKTAGSSVTDWLRAQVPAASWCPPKDWTQLVQQQPDRLSRYKLFCGHFGWGLDEVVGRRLATVTVFRDPLQRTLSHYRHVHRDPTHPRHRTVSGQSFAQIVADSDNWPMIENFQARYLVRNVVDPRRLFGRLDPDPVKLNRLSTATEEARHLFSTDHVRTHATGISDSSPPWARRRTWTASCNASRRAGGCPDAPGRTRRG